MNSLYTTEATARGGREGEVVSDDGVLDLVLAVPGAMGGPGGDATNPEMLFAAGYAACFHSAVRMVAGKERVDITGSQVTARVTLGMDDAGFALAVTLTGSFPTLAPERAQALMEQAHQVCPYSRATRGNVDVALTVG